MINNVDYVVNDHQSNVLSYLEFYSGIGGWTMALEEALQRVSPK